MAVIMWKCPNCGGSMKFNPSSQDFECEYCMSHFTEEELKAQAEILKEKERQVPVDDAADGNAGAAGVADGNTGDTGSGAMDGNAGDPGVGMADEKNQAQKAEEKVDAKGEKQAKPVVQMLYTCPSCGAEIVTDETTAATRCFYCQNPVVLQGRLEGAYEPQKILPFAIDQAKAKSMFTDWIKKKRYVPSDFYSPSQIKNMTGVYFPYWLYSCKIDGKLEAQGRKVRTWRTGDMEYTETQMYQVNREGHMNVDNLTRNALKKADKQLVEGVMPFKPDQIKPFSMEYLTGFMAEKRDMERETFEQEVTAEVKNFARSSLLNNVSGYNSVSPTVQREDIRDAKWEYALLPVWTLTYKGKNDGKIYYYACNGQTGKISGKLPVDSKKLGILFLEVFVPLFAILLTVGYFI